MLWELGGGRESLIVTAEMTFHMALLEEALIAEMQFHSSLIL